MRPAARRFGKPFAELAFERQTELLAEVENNDNEFFDLIRTHTMQASMAIPATAATAAK